MNEKKSVPLKREQIKEYDIKMMYDLLRGKEKIKAKEEQPQAQIDAPSSKSPIEYYESNTEEDEKPCVIVQDCNRESLQEEETLNPPYAAPQPAREKPRIILTEPEKPVVEINDSKRISAMHNPGNSLNLYDFVQYFKIPIVNESEGSITRIIGAEDLEVIIGLAVAKKTFFGIEGKAGSGKTLLVDRVLDLLDNDAVYKSGDSISESSLYRDADTINKCEIFYTPELQKVVKELLEFYKTSAEGKVSKKSVTNKKGQVETYLINPIQIIWTLATSNVFKPDPELRRRFLVGVVENDLNVIKDINKTAYDLCHTLSFEEDKNEKLEKSLKQHMAFLRGKENVFYFDPFADYLADVIPNTERSVSYKKHWLELLRASALFHYNDREKFTHKGKEVIMVALEDHYIVNQAYRKHFLDTLKIDASDADLKLIEEKEAFQINWSQYLKTGIDFINSEHPGAKELRAIDKKLPDKWFGKQIGIDGIYTTDYITGDKIKICDISGVSLK